MTAADVIDLLHLRPHPEGGHYRETWRHDDGEGRRGAGTSIYFLLQSDERSHWHRIDAAEHWHFYSGAPLELATSTDGHTVERRTLGPALHQGHRPQLMVPPHTWQSARTLGDWTLVGCTVSPAFDFDAFELAPPGWEPG